MQNEGVNKILWTDFQDTKKHRERKLRMQLIPKNQRSTTLFKTFWKKPQTLVEHIIYYYYLFQLQSLFNHYKIYQEN